MLSVTWSSALPNAAKRSYSALTPANTVCDTFWVKLSNHEGYYFVVLGNCVLLTCDDWGGTVTLFVALAEMSRGRPY